ncbi:hypothetical protein CAEBREN_12709 [Caenorhabditis brenneri]|uniref:3'-5' exonuclease domain-containing protein n=1 Tax=Caenorhabditis brenneri TaxID=135651 RepID=G0NY57_CAEBE|nr:hypothetical protein CAEBREN_12709 [Caenorhabditis brenneri]
MPETPHQYVRNKLGKFVEQKKDLDLTTVSDMVKYGSSKGPYPQYLARQIWSSLMTFFSFVHPSENFSAAIEINLFSMDRDRREIIAQLAAATSILRPVINYYEFRPGNIKIIATDKIGIWLDLLMDFSKPSKYPIYFDTEGLYSERSFGCKIAALTFYDVEFYKVLIIRIHRFNCQDYDLVKREIGVLARTRNFAIFGAEPFLEKLVPATKLYDCQRDMTSLKEMCEKIGVYIHKGQTMSNWARRFLRRDQLQYAAMDTVALLYLHDDQIKRGDLEKGKFPKKIQYANFEDW